MPHLNVNSILTFKSLNPWKAHWSCVPQPKISPLYSSLTSSRTSRLSHRFTQFLTLALRPSFTWCPEVQSWLWPDLVSHSSHGQTQHARSFCRIQGLPFLFGVANDTLAGSVHGRSQCLTTYRYSHYTSQYNWLLGSGAGSAYTLLCWYHFHNVYKRTPVVFRKVLCQTTR